MDFMFPMCVTCPKFHNSQELLTISVPYRKLKLEFLNWWTMLILNADMLLVGWFISDTHRS